MILDLDLVLNFVVFGKGVSHNGDKHIEEMEHEDECRHVVETSQDLALNITASSKTRWITTT